MTLLQITVSADRALIATDTAVYASDQGAPGADVYHWPNGAPVAVTKLHPLPHIRAVLTGRGTSTVRQFALDQVTHARDFDHAVELLNRALPLLPALPGSYKGEPLRHSVYLVGWSGDSMALATWDSPSYTGRVQRCNGGTQFQVLGPAAKRPSWLFDEARQAELAAYLTEERRRQVQCIESAAAYARQAVADARQDDPAAPYGGRLLVAELTRDTYRTLDAGDLGLPPRRPGARDLITELQSALCIVANAATEVFGDETGAGSVSIPGTGGTSFATCASRSYTNATGRTITVQWDAEVVGLHFSAGATLASPDDYCTAQWVCAINGTPVQTDAFIDTASDLSPPAVGAKITRTVSWQRALNAGDTMNVYIAVGGGTDTNAVTISWARTRLRTSVIKV